MDRFYIVTSDADSSGTQDHQHSHDPQQAVAAVQQQRPASPAAAAVPQLQPASMATAVQPRARSLPASLSPSARDMHAMFQQGSGFQQLAAERNVALSTVVDYVIKAAGLGLPLDWARAASELQLGPQDSVSSRRGGRTLGGVRVGRQRGPGGGRVCCAGWLAWQWLALFLPCSRGRHACRGQGNLPSSSQAGSYSAHSLHTPSAHWQLTSSAGMAQVF